MPPAASSRRRRRTDPVAYSYAEQLCVGIRNTPGPDAHS
ncbi:MAG: hypothetical protein QOC83_4118, partial [Pseudonocardiales bacterium]|nr:hypothetical protein [Pseudonocardiales bacterium]